MPFEGETDKEALRLMTTKYSFVFVAASNDPEIMLLPGERMMLLAVPSGVVQGGSDCVVVLPESGSVIK